MDESIKAEFNNIHNIINTSCYSEFMKYYTKVIKYIEYEFSSEYSTDIITKVVLQFYNVKHPIIIKIQNCFNNNYDSISSFLIYLIGTIQYNLDKKYKNN